MSTRLKDYRIYGRAPREKRFKAMDMDHMVQVTQLSKATVYWARTESQVSRLKAKCEQLKLDKPGWIFELREKLD
jgi:hypothetical protein